MNLRVVLAVISILFIKTELDCFELNSLGHTLNRVGSKLHGYYNTIKCKLTECCGRPYIKHDFNGLQKDLDKKLFGQPLVKQTVISAIKSHFLLENPTKALVLSFHGPTGTGKNYVTKMLIENLYDKELNSKFIHYFVGSRDFPHNKRVPEYMEYIKQMLEYKMKKCEYSLFVFDEIDKLPLSLIDVIRSYIDVDPVTVGYNPRKSVFIFLSNLGAKVINQITLNLHESNIERNNFNLTSFRHVIEDYLFNHKTSDEKGFWHSTLISNHLIDHYVPFLPLERQHVKECVKAEIIKYKSLNKKLNDSSIESILNQITYEPEDSKLYAQNGCKRISHLVRKLIIEDNMRFKDAEKKTEL